jgi:hypothetical protein
MTEKILKPTQGWILKEKPDSIVIDMRLYEFKTDEMRIHFTHWLESVLNVNCKIELRK